MSTANFFYRVYFHVWDEVVFVGHRLCDGALKTRAEDNDQDKGDDGEEGELNQHAPRQAALQLSLIHI